MGFSLTQAHAKRIACTFHAHTEGRPTGSCHGDHFVVVEVVDVSEQKRLTLIGWQIGECMIDAANKSVVWQPDVCVTDGLWQNRGVVDEGMVSLAFSGQCTAAIAEDAKEPWIERLIAAKAREVVMNANEGVLHGLFGIARIAEHGAGKTQRPRVVPLDQLREARSIALARPTQDVWRNRVCGEIS